LDEKDNSELTGGRRPSTLLTTGKEQGATGSSSLLVCCQAALSDPELVKEQAQIVVERTKTVNAHARRSGRERTELTRSRARRQR
jgi:hypothetical protein